MTRREAEQLIRDEAETHGRFTARAIAAMTSTRLPTDRAMRAVREGERRHAAARPPIVGDVGAWLDGVTLCP